MKKKAAIITGHIHKNRIVLMQMRSKNSTYKYSIKRVDDIPEVGNEFLFLIWQSIESFLATRLFLNSTCNENEITKWISEWLNYTKALINLSIESNRSYEFLNLDELLRIKKNKNVEQDWYIDQMQSYVHTVSQILEKFIDISYVRDIQETLMRIVGHSQDDEEKNNLEAFLKLVKVYKGSMPNKEYLFSEDNGVGDVKENKVLMHPQDGQADQWKYNATAEEEKNALFELVEELEKELMRKTEHFQQLHESIIRLQNAVNINPLLN